jgi:DNA-damage-inducible protein D
MASELIEHPAAQHTMQRMEEAKRQTGQGQDYWLAREIAEILGYQKWQNFHDNVIARARDAIEANGGTASHHIAETSKMVGVGDGGKRRVVEYFLSRAACYLIAMNGDPAKPEIAGAQAYFTVQTRKQELLEAEVNARARIHKREKVTDALKRVADVAKNVGVTRYDHFHGAKYDGLYQMSAREVSKHKGLREGETLLDRAGHLELSAHAFQADLAAEKILNDGISGEAAAIKTNREVARHVRKLVISEAGRAPEDLPLEPEPIQEVRKRIKSPSPRRITRRSAKP